MKFEIVSAMAEHLNEILELEREIFTLPWTMKDFLYETDSPDAYFIAALGESGEVLGFCILHTMSGEGDIYNVAVRESARGHGIGKALVLDAVGYADDVGIRKVFLEVRESNAAARALYEQCGFKSIGIRHNYYDEPEEDAVMMVREYKNGSGN